jgi:hypothetical protein
MVEMELKRKGFQPGHPKVGGGRRQKKMATVDEIVEIALPAMAEKSIEAAMNGDAFAASVLFSYVSANRREQIQNKENKKQ